MKISKLIIFLVLINITLIDILAKELKVEEAVEMAMETDSRILNNMIDISLSKSELKSIKDSRLPIFSVSGSYNKLSDIDNEITFNGVTIPIESQSDIINFTANLKYSITTAYKTEKLLHLAKIGIDNKEFLLDKNRILIAFETKRIYWESVRAINIAIMLNQNLELLKQNLDLMDKKFSEGSILYADKLLSKMRYDQGLMDLREGEYNRDQIVFNLKALLLQLNSKNFNNYEKLILISNPKDLKEPVVLDENELINMGIRNNPTLKSNELFIDISQENKKVNQLDLLPNIDLTGNYTFANPNSRALFDSSEDFIGTWSVGISASYNILGIPKIKSKIHSKEIKIEDALNSRNSTIEQIITDIKIALFSYNRLSGDLDMLKEMILQYQEKERVVKEQRNNGLANDIEVFSASIARLKAEFEITNKQIDLQIAVADLNRAIGSIK